MIVWVKPWLSRRSEFGVYNNIFQELRLEEKFEYKTFLRMAVEDFDELRQQNKLHRCVTQFQLNLN